MSEPTPNADEQEPLPPYSDTVVYDKEDGTRLEAGH